METQLRNRPTREAVRCEDPQVSFRVPNGPGRRSVWSALAYTLVIVVVVSACGSSGGRTTTKPGRTAGSVTFSELPRYKGGTSVSEPTVTGGKTTQTFEVDGASPQKILDFYARELRVSWTLREKPHALTDGSQSAWRGRWANGDATLLVSSEQTPTNKQGSAQYSLDLRKN